MSSLNIRLMDSLSNLLDGLMVCPSNLNLVMDSRSPGINNHSLTMAIRNLGMDSLDQIMDSNLSLITVSRNLGMVSPSNLLDGKVARPINLSPDMVSSQTTDSNPTTSSPLKTTLLSLCPQNEISLFLIH